MRNRVPDEATCAICGRHFDPSETRGWCPNPSCGEWQHPAFPVDETESGDEPAERDEESQTSTAPSTPTKDCPNCGNEVRADANFCKHCAAQLSGDSGEADEDETDDATAIECPDCGADLSQIPSDRLSQCPICMFDLSPTTGSGDTAGADAGTSAGAGTAPGTGAETGTGLGDDTGTDTGSGFGNDTGTDSGSGFGNDTGTDSGSGFGDDTGPGRGAETGHDLQPEALTECPNCGEDLTPMPPEMRTVCPGCRVDLEEGVERGADSGGRSPSGTTGGSAGDTASTALAEVDDIASGYVQRLSEAGITTMGELNGADPDTVSAKTGISARRIRSWVEKTSADDSSPAEPASGTDGVGTGVDRQSTRIQRSPDELVLSVMDQELTVTDGETVGRDVRSAMVQAGAPEEEAVYVHRKHIRIEVDEEGFWLTRLGENGLTVNGQPIEKGATVPIEDGDEVGFSDVVTATVTVR